MRKFLAVLLAVAILGVAGAAFAVDAGHTTPGETTTGNKVVVNSTAVKAKTDVVAKDAVKFEGTGVEVTAVDTAAASKDVEDYAAKGYVVAAVAPTLKVTSTVEEISMDITFNDSYVGQTVSADLRKQASADVALAGGMMYYFVNSADVSKDVKIGTDKKLTLVIKNADTGTYKPVVTFAVTEAIPGVAEELKVSAAAYDAVVALYGKAPDVIFEVKESATTKDSKAVLALGNVSADKTGLYMSNEASFSTFVSLAKSGAALSVDIDSKSVQAKLADAAFTNTSVIGSDGQRYKTVSPSLTKGVVAYEVTATDDKAHAVSVEAAKSDGGSSDPTSSKGSGGCNGGFAGIAVLALGLAALRRKAR